MLPSVFLQFPVVFLIVVFTLNSNLFTHACSPGAQKDIGKYVDFSNYDSETSDSMFANSPSDLTCDFDSSSPCFWKNAKGNDIQWQKAHFKDAMSSAKLKSLTGRSELPGGNFLAIGSMKRNPSDQGTLIGRVRCQMGSGKLTFDRWLSSAKTHFEVCIRKNGTNSKQSCATVPRTGPNPFEYDVPSSNQPFDILLTASNFVDPSFVAIDNIHYTGVFCNADDSTTGVPVSCGSLLSCNFDNQFCNWNNSGSGSSRGVWNRNKGVVGNPSIGIRRSPSAYYANVGDAVLDQPASRSDSSPVYVLESPKFNLTSPAVLQFDMFQKAVGPRLSVCAGKNVCTEERNDVTDEWKTHTLNLPMGIQTIQFVAKDLKINDFIGVSNILVDESTQPGCVKFGRSPQAIL